MRSPDSVLRLFNRAGWLDAEARYKAVLFSKGVISLMLVVLITFIIASFVQPQYIPRYLAIIFTVLLLTLTSLFGLREKNVNVVAGIYISFLLFIIVFFSWSGGGIRGHGISLLPVVVAFAGLAIGRKYIWYFSASAALGGLLLMCAHYFEWLPTTEPLGHSPLVYWMYSVTAIFLLSLIEYLSVERLQKSLDETKRELILRKESEDKYRRIFNSFQDVYYQTDIEGKITIITPSVEARTGYTPEEVTGRNVAEFYVDASQRNAFLQQLKESGYVYNYDLDMIHKDGTVRNVSASSRILYDDAKKPVAVEGTLHDITQRKKAENDLKLQNKGLMDIAFLQSHIVRAPLTNVLALINLINKNDANDPVNLEMIPKLKEAGDQLDAIVHHIVQKTNEIRSSVDRQSPENPESLY
jgi:PAS domain S-box-containing protein